MELQEVAEHLKHELVTCDELAAWFAMFARYHTGKQGTSDLPRGLSMHSAGGFSYHRKTGDRRRIVVPHAAVSVTGGIQPGVLARALTADFLDAGLAARLLMVMPPKRPKRWTEVEIDPDTEAAYQATLDRLLALGFDTGGGEKAPHVLQLSAEAKARWVAFYEHWAQEQNTVEGELAAAYSKLEAYAARFALLHHVVTHAYLEADDRRPVGARSVEAGITLTGWFAREARRIYATFTESTEQREMRRLVEFIQARGGRITVRQLMRANCRRFPGAEAAELALAALVEADLARWVEPPTGMKGGLPIKAVELCLTHDTDDTEPPDDNQEEGDGGLGVYDIDPPGDNGPPAAMPQGEAGQPVPLSLPSGVIGVMRQAEVPGPEADDPAQGSAGSGAGALSRTSVTPSRFRVMARGASPPPNQLVRDPAGLAMVRMALADTGQVGLDVETTGLDPRRDRVRLLSVSADTIDGGRFAYLIDCFAVDPAPLFEVLADKELVLHHALFDLAFLARMDFVPAGRVRDTMLLAQLVTAGTGERVSLAACCERWLGLALDKAGQKSDWSSELTAEQLAYAATDVEVLVALWAALDAEVRQADLGRAAVIEERCLPAVAWMARQGVPFDRETWFALARAADAEAERLRDELRQASPPHPEPGGAWNWDSPAQAKQALARVGCLVQDTTDETLAAADHPLARLLRCCRLARKRGGTYGTDWLRHIAADGRVYAHWHPCGAKTGRMSSSRPNLQNVPRAGAYRRCFRAPPGRVLVPADFAQIELRIAAKATTPPGKR